jgi:STE24 endopeptidase
MFEPRAVPVALVVYVSLQFIATPLNNAITRRYEREADWVALRSARAPATQRAMLIKLATLTQSDPDPPTWEYILFDNHPTFAQRVALTNAWQAHPG